MSEAMFYLVIVLNLERAITMPNLYTTEQCNHAVEEINRQIHKGFVRPICVPAYLKEDQ